MPQKPRNNATRAQPRAEACVTFEDGSVYSAPLGTPLEEYFVAARRALIPPARQPGDPDDETAIAAICDGQLRELSYAVQRDVSVQPVYSHESDGTRIYRRSLSFVMGVAAQELFPDVKLTLDHALPFGGFYCTVVGGPPLTQAQVNQLKKAMADIIVANASITRSTIALDEAIALFEARGDDDKLRLLESRSKDFLVLYDLRGVKDYFFGYLVPSTGYLTVWDLQAVEGGFLLRYPRRQQPTALQPVGDLGKIQQVFLEMGRWLDLMEVEDVGRLNQAVRAGRARELILVAEALHEARIGDVADEIVGRQPGARLVLIAGPSSSGKTTFAKRLAVQLMAHGLKPFTLSLDNYFVNRDETPLDENGEYDFERLETIDLDLFNRHQLALLDGQEVHLPEFDFVLGRRQPGEVVQLTPEHVIIVEGIHGMNPALIRDVPPERAFRIYASALTQLNIDRYNRVPTTDVRLLRRLVRDATYRGYSAMDTLGRWESVRRGEKRWVFPFQENADVMFNTALVYELAVLRPLVEPLLRQVEPNTRRHMEAKRLLAFLSWVHPLEPDLVPDNSLLREFIGGSILRDYEPGQHITHKEGSDATLKTFA